MSKSTKKQVQNQTLDQLKEGDEGPIVVMICRMWDVHNINGGYLSTDFVVSDEKENVMHCSMKSNISHCFVDKIQPGAVVSMRSFAVQRRYEYRIIRENDYFLELNGYTAVRKVCNKVGGFLRHPFQLMDFESIQPTEKKYLIDVIGFVTTVGKTAQPRTGSKNLDFPLINERGRALRVTLWGKLGDQLLKMMASHSGKYTIILTSMSAKYYNGQLGISSCSSTLILDSDEIPAIVAFKSQISVFDAADPTVPISATKSQDGTLEKLLALGRDRRKDAAILHCKAEIVGIRIKNSWYYPACGGGKCKKGVTRKDGQLWCDACNKPVNYPKPRYRLEVDVKDETTQVVIVLWDETATELTKSSAKALLDELDEVEDESPSLPNALTNLYNTKHVFEIRSHSYYNYGEFESFTCTGVFPINDSIISDVHDAPDDSNDFHPEGSSNAVNPGMKRLVRGPQLTTPAKSNDGKKKRRYIEEDSDTEEADVAAVQLDRHDKDHTDNGGYFQ